MKAWVFQVFHTYSAYCIFQTEGNETGDKLLSSIYLQNDIKFPYFSNKSNIGDPIKVDYIQEFVIEPYYSETLRSKSVERFYVYPNLQ